MRSQTGFRTCGYYTREAALWATLLTQIEGK